MFGVLKNLTVPTGETKTIVAIKSWSVRWISKQGTYPFERKTEETEVFVSEETANTFAQSLRNAFKLLRYSADTKISITENKELK